MLSPVLCGAIHNALGSTLSIMMVDTLNAYYHMLLLKLFSVIYVGLKEKES